jgi:NAD(P) transhydrogenase subunit alpha
MQEQTEGGAASDAAPGGAEPGAPRAVVVGVPRESCPGERRVAATPDSVRKLVQKGFSVVVQAGAGLGAACTDAAYADAGAQIDDEGRLAWGADVVLKVRAPRELDGGHELDRLRRGAVLSCLIWPAQNGELVQRLADLDITTLALDQVPRISRAQKMDVLSSMANIAGYRAVLEAAHHFGGFFGGQITAAGRTRPAQVLVIGAGVAGLAAIAAARGLGAEVRAFDVRASVKDQVRSLGARFLEVDIAEDAETAGGYAKTMSKEFIEAEMALFRAQAPEVDIVITTALIPGKRAPVLWTREAVGLMRRGSVVVDLAAEQGGNCGYTEADRTVVTPNGVTVLGHTDLTSRLATHASQFFATNLVHLLDELGNTALNVDLANEVIRGALATHAGAVTFPPPPVPVSAAPGPVAAAGPTAVARPAASASPTWVLGGLGLSLMGVIGTLAPPEFVQHFTVFVLACVIGWQLIWNVTPALHTPLMSVTNAVSGIILVGGILQAASGELSVAAVLGAVAVLVASVNIAGGFLVTQRMLGMFKKEG